MNNKINVLISLHRGYGLGDATQMSAVLRHVAKYRPNWAVDFQAEEGRHCVGRNIVSNTFEFGKNPNPNKVYDAEVEICLFDNWYNWKDRPNTHVSQALHERFGLEWDRECSGYQVNWSRDVGYAAQAAMSKFIAKRDRLSTRAVAVHYQGDSAPQKKDLSDGQVDAICDHILSLGYVPLLIDWRNMSPVANRIDVCTTGREVFSRSWGRSADYNCAVVNQCAAFVGIDSGPAKCASATNVPSLVVWTGHHPAEFHDPAINTTHLVPCGYHELKPVCNNKEAVDWFEANYSVREYLRDPVLEVCRWLGETLK